MTNLLSRLCSLVCRRHKPRRAQYARGWTASFRAGPGGISKLVTVAAMSRDETVAKLKAAGFDIVNPSEVRPTLAIQAKDVACLRTDVSWQVFDWQSRRDAALSFSKAERIM